MIHMRLYCRLCARDRGRDVEGSISIPIRKRKYAKIPTPPFQRLSLLLESPFSGSISLSLSHVSLFSFIFSSILGSSIIGVLTNSISHIHVQSTPWMNPNPAWLAEMHQCVDDTYLA